MRRAGLLRAPALHFVVLGGLLFALAGDGDRSAPALVATPIASARAASDADLLLEEALALGIDRRDPLVRARLAGLGRLADAGAVEDAAHLEREARRLGLERRDVVVRRHLTQVMALALAHGGPRQWPSEAELAACAERHRQRFVQPARVRFTHVFFARDRAGESAAAAAARAHARLAATKRATPAGDLAGDASLWGSTVAMSEAEVARRFGPAFAAALARAPLDRWSGPVASSHGMHVVRIEERIPERLPPLDAVRSRVVHAWLAERAAERLERRLAERRARL